MDLGSATAVAALREFQGKWKPFAELARQGSYVHAFTAGTHAKLVDKQRPPPLVPEEFAERVKLKTVTNGKDKAVLIELQAKVATEVLQGVQTLDFKGLGWGLTEARLLAMALQLCPKLTSLNLMENKLGAEGVQLLTAFLNTNLMISELKCGRFDTTDIPVSP